MTVLEPIRHTLMQYHILPSRFSFKQPSARQPATVQKAGPLLLTLLGLLRHQLDDPILPQLACLDREWLAVIERKRFLWPPISRRYQPGTQHAPQRSSAAVASAPHKECWLAAASATSCIAPPNVLSGPSSLALIIWTCYWKVRG